MALPPSQPASCTTSSSHSILFLFSVHCCLFCLFVCWWFILFCASFLILSFLFSTTEKSHNNMANLQNRITAELSTQNKKALKNRNASFALMRCTVNDGANRGLQKANKGVISVRSGYFFFLHYFKRFLLLRNQQSVSFVRLLFRLEPDFISGSVLQPEICMLNSFLKLNIYTSMFNRISGRTLCPIFHVSLSSA